MYTITCMVTDADLDSIAPGEYVRFEIDDRGSMAVMVKLNAENHGGKSTEADHLFMVVAPRFVAFPAAVPRHLKTTESFCVNGQEVKVASHVYINS